MLVQALAAYADTYLPDRLADPAFEEKPVGWVIGIYPDGTFAQLIRRARPVARGKKTYSEDLPLIVPKSPVNRNSGTYALPGCDAVAYLVGPGEAWSKEKDPVKKERESARHVAQHADFVSKVTAIANDLKAPAWLAAARFFGNALEIGKARAALEREKIKPGSIVTMTVVLREAGAGSVPTLIEDPDFRALWRGRYGSDSGARIDPASSAMCLISGRVGPVAETHDKIKRVGSLGGQPSGVALMSFDKSAFESYGWKKNANSPVSPDRASAYVLALNDLLHPGPHRRGATVDKLVTTRKDVAGTGFLFWSARPTDDDFLSLIMEPNEDSVRSLLDSVRSGRAPDEFEESEVFLLAVAGNGARLVVRHWAHDSLANMRRRIAAWFAALRIADRNGVAGEFPLRLLAEAANREATRKGGSEGKQGETTKKEKKVTGLELALVRRAFEGTALGHADLARLLRRLRLLRSKKSEQGSRADPRLLPHRIALVRMCVNDLTAHAGSKEVPMSEALDEGRNNAAYVCGRLLAVYGSLQSASVRHAGQRDLGITIVDRYYGLASTNPSVAFPKVDGLGKHYLQKLRRLGKAGLAEIFERRLRELFERLERRFPSQLGLEDQGRFVIGFHHQKAEDWRRMAQAKAKKENAEKQVDSKQ
jgi:CRISPR-associated protein Csd1